MDGNEETKAKKKYRNEVRRRAVSTLAAGCVIISGMPGSVIPGSRQIPKETHQKQTNKANKASKQTK